MDFSDSFQSSNPPVLNWRRAFHSKSVPGRIRAILPSGESFSPLLNLRSRQVEKAERGPFVPIPDFSSHSSDSGSGLVFEDLSVNEGDPDISKAVGRNPHWNGGKGVLVAGGRVRTGGVCEGRESDFDGGAASGVDHPEVAGGIEGKAHRICEVGDLGTPTGRPGDTRGYSSNLDDAG